MRRKILALLLLPCVLLSQAVTFGHVHAEGTPAGHGARPHVHIDSESHEHGHVHSHGHHHDEGDDGSSDSEPTAPSDHDSDASYTGYLGAVVVRRALSDHQVSFWQIWTLTDISMPVRQAVDLSRVARHSRYGERPFFELCPLYVQQLALLI